MNSLLNETREQRYQWIITDCPPVEVIFDEFPCLKDPQILKNEFNNLTGSTSSKLFINCQRLLQYASKETKREVKKLMKSYLMLQQPTDDQMMTYAISVATLLATARGKSRPLLFMTIQGENIDMDEALCKIQHSHPHILGFGSDLSNNYGGV
ncbi:PREDICTED: uncharacterized protein LOC109583804 [Amphimedon queenslandica]|uniref:Uncharacterized protein n=1 Tax=Amphimedon queenslandica TaxID=400682 RepID=A0A1X7UEB0_AMPQE|nr:PREDICTED: uncharacterized protein LOC109583804 [Amphimedon queenslandica]|eukprot:XP_019854842.1 PREDICTED: uncharacterized protein LOC109583804 [Amphimedon queenslandica]